MSAAQSLRGTIKKVEVKFAYVRTDEGDVFVPLNASVPKNQDCPDLREAYEYGDEVSVKAVKQDQSKNGCLFRGVHMRKVKNTATSSVGSPSIRTDETQTAPDDFIKVRVTSVTETFAYADVPEYGSIFVPGGAFDSKETTRLNAYLKIDDLLLVRIEEQKEVNGCRWKAIVAMKFISEHGGERQFSGFGKIVKLEDFYCLLHCNELSTHYIYCNLLTYTGGDSGVNAETLKDILTVGDYIMFVSEYREPEWRATNWYSFKSRGVHIEDIARHVNKEYAESHTQTNLCMEFRLLRTILERNEQLTKEHPTMCSLIDKDIWTK